jgi:hypothetical protein
MFIRWPGNMHDCAHVRSSFVQVGTAKPQGGHGPMVNTPLVSSNAWQTTDLFLAVVDWGGGWGRRGTTALRPLQPPMSLPFSILTFMAFFIHSLSTHPQRRFPVYKAIFSDKYLRCPLPTRTWNTFFSVFLVAISVP